jgi:hypothetical protein
VPTDPLIFLNRALWQLPLLFLFSGSKNECPQPRMSKKIMKTLGQEHGLMDEAVCMGSVITSLEREENSGMQR